MNFFTHKYRKTIESVCPVCGKKHITCITDTQQYYMDGTLQLTLDEYLERYIVCDVCNMIYDVVAPNGSRKQMNPQYMQLLQRPLDNWMKIQLLQLKEGMPQYDLLLLYYKETKQHDKWRETINDAIATNEPLMIQFGCDNLPQIQLHSLFIMDESIQRVDLLRQASRFDEALQQIETLQNIEYHDEPNELWAYLTFERKLIQKHNNKKQ